MYEKVKLPSFTKGSMVYLAYGKPSAGVSSCMLMLHVGGELYQGTGKQDSKGQWMRKLPGGKGYEKYCKTCNVWRTPRASHCSICGFCMVSTLVLAGMLAGYTISLVCRLKWCNWGTICICACYACCHLCTMLSLHPGHGRRALACRTHVLWCS